MLCSVDWNYLSIHEFRWCSRWSLGIDTEFRSTLNWARAYLAVLILKLIHDSKRDLSILFTAITLERRIYQMIWKQSTSGVSS